MTTMAFSREWTCSTCGENNVIVEQPEFKNLCSVLLAGLSGVIVCRKCGREDFVRFTGEVLEMVVD